MLEVNIHNCGFEDKDHIISDLHFSVNKGEVLAIVGESGVGKSTLLKAIAGLIPVIEGGVKLEGRILKKAKEALIAGDDEVALVNQDFNEDLYFTIEENIKAAMLHLTIEDQKEFMNELLSVLSLELIKDKQARYLSGGEKQRVSLACALAKEPKVLLLDEPFAHIDVYLRKKIGSYLKRLVKEKNTSMVWVSHEGEEAMSWGDFIMIANHTKWLGKFTPEEVYFDYKDQPFARYFGEVNEIQYQGQKYCFRPWNYSLSGDDKNKLKVRFKYHSLRNGYYANYFDTNNNEEIVLFSLSILSDCTEIYV
jgi:iron(III) transport system ATP-binding protein